MEVLGAYGKALADAGQLQQAADVLSRSYTPEHPNWSDMSTQGSIADQLGDHAQAQQFYQDALETRARRAGDPDQSRPFLRAYQAIASRRTGVAAGGGQSRARMRECATILALVLSLQGKFDEAERVERESRSAAAAAANVAAIRQMIAQSNSWRDIQTLDAKGKKKTVKPAPDKAAGGNQPLTIDRPAG